MPGVWNTLTLPPYDDYYIVTVKGAQKAMSLYYSTEDHTWSDEHFTTYEVAAWMPFPKAYGTENC